MRWVASQQHRRMPNGDALLAHNTLHRLTADGPNKGVHILERPLHIPNKPPRLLSGEGCRGRTQIEDCFLPRSSEMQRRSGLRKDVRKRDACLVHGNTQDLPEPYPTLLTGNAVRCRTEHGVKVRSSCIKYKRHIQPGKRWNVPSQSLPRDGADASRRPDTHVELEPGSRHLRGRR
jgi:hypothetical protein